MIKKLLPALKGYGKPALLAPLFAVLEVGLEIIMPFIMANIINIGIANADFGYIVRTGLVMIALALLALACGVLCGRFASVAGTGFAKGLRGLLFANIQRFSFANMDRFNTASLITRLTTDITSIQQSFLMSMRMLARAPVMLVSASFMAFMLNGRLAVVFLVAIPFMVAGFYLVARVALPRFIAMLKKYDRLNESVQENLIAIRVVKSFVRQGHENEKFVASSQDLKMMQQKAEKLMLFAMPLMMFTMNACMIAVCWFGGNMIIGGSMQPGDLMAFLAYITQILISLMLAATVIIMLIMSRASAARIAEVLDEVPEITDESADRGLEVTSGDIEFDRVTFSYDPGSDEPTLSDVSLSIKSGETVGIIGGTGSAKTTLVQLIPRLYDVTKGAVRVGGRDVREYTMHQLREAVAMVLQNNVLFSGTIAENLRWGNPGASDEDIETACVIAQAHDFIMGFPDGYQTVLGQGGVNLSGGQKQRLCIARALVKNPRILILDDSTSAVDTATDSRIRSHLSKKTRDMTTIIIAQRITSVSDADKIIVMEGGRIDDVGTHKELLTRNTIYREVYTSQQKGVA
ncbi:MAG: ABC transporter ATP-binding protein [Christensenellales bacterium]